MILNRQRSIHVSPARLENFLARVQRALRLPRDSATVCLVTSAQIAKWNRAYRGKSKPTDVLSFPATPRNSRDSSRGKGTRLRRPGNWPRKGGSKSVRARAGFLGGRSFSSDINGLFASGVSTPEGVGYLGDIAIAPAVARRNARRARRSLDGELRVLILHGVLHLLGYDHETDGGEMERLELRLRRRLEIG